MSTRTPVELHEIDLPRGTIRYRDEGTGPPIVFVHGVLVHGGLWSKVVDHLDGDFRCVSPDWPLGSHAVPMAPDADLTPVGLADLVAAFIEGLGAGPVTLVGNDSGGAISQLVATHHPERVAKLVLTNCDAFDQFPPRMFAYLRWAAFIPGALPTLAQSMRLKSARRLPIAFGWLSKEPMDDELVDSFVRPGLESSAIRRDARKVLRGLSPRYTRAAAENLPSFDRPALVAWGTEDKFFPADHARKLAEILPNARLEWIEGARAFVAQDRPDRLAQLLREFVGGSEGTVA
ncbi:MAG TPA: alpha/beta hydrolase [Actinomycetota bacterium]|jgi:pimeloyl-ACP methyl ester carboxylesterase